MSNSFYLEHGYTPVTKFQEWTTAASKAVWTPTTSMRVVITALTISNNAAAGTIRVTFGDVGGSNIAEFTVGASATISPVIGAIECTMYDRGIYATPSTSSSTGGWRITAQGFELA